MASGIALVQQFTERDRAVVELVGRFRQVSAQQIGAALFSESASKTPLDRCLKRLVARHYLARLSRPVGGDGGGSAQFVYQLGRDGWRLLDRPGQYWAPRAINWHVLAFADCYVRLLGAEQEDTLTLLSFEPEPSCHVAVGSVSLTPDAMTEIGVRALGIKFRLWLEVDRASEHRRVIQDKCVRYWRAYQAWDGEVYPFVAFVVPDERRRREIRSVIAGGPSEAQALFRVLLPDELVQEISTGIGA